MHQRIYAVTEPTKKKKWKIKNPCASKIGFATRDIRPDWGQYQPRIRDLSTYRYWINPRFNKAMLFPLKQLLWECLFNRDRVPANIKDLLVSWKVCNETLVELHQSDRSIRPVSRHYPISWRWVRIQCSRLRPSLCPSAREESRNPTISNQLPSSNPGERKLPFAFIPANTFPDCPSSVFSPVESRKHISDRKHVFFKPSVFIYV